MRRESLSDLPEVPALPTGYVLREAGPDDAAGLAGLLHRAFADATWTTERVRGELLDAPAVEKTFVIANGDALLATASARQGREPFPDSGYLHWVAVEPSAQGHKLGTVVSLAVLHEFVRMGYQSAVLETDDERIAAIKTYNHLGFVPEHAHETHAERWAVILANLAAAANL